MARLVKIAAVALVFIAADESCNVSGEDTQVMTPNPWEEFWNTHCLVWTVKTSDSGADKCKQQQRKYINKTGVLLNTTKMMANSILTTEDVFWEFRTNSSIARRHKGIDGTYYGEEVIYLVYENATGSCCVVKHEGYYYRTESSQEDYYKRCHDPWCTCVSSGLAMRPHSCLMPDAVRRRRLLFCSAFASAHTLLSSAASLPPSTATVSRTTLHR